MVIWHKHVVGRHTGPGEVGDDDIQMIMIYSLNTYTAERRDVLYLYTAERRDVLGCKSLTIKRFPEAREISRGQSPRVDKAPRLSYL